MPKHRSFSVKYKLSVVAWHNENGHNVSRTAREHCVDRKRVREWLASETLLNLHKRGKDGQMKRIIRTQIYY